MRSATEQGRAGARGRTSRGTGPRRVGLFGGTFDPPHLGHLALAEWARERLELDHVLFIPAARPPHKRRRDMTGLQTRLAMTRLAVRGNPAFRVSTLEARRDGPSFTIDTLRSVRRGHPGARLYLLMGEDSLDEFRAWREPDGIRRLATLAVAARRGPRGRRRRLPGVVWLENPSLDISSRAIRARARRGASLRYLVPDRVARFIEQRRVYRRRALTSRTGGRAR